MSESQNAYYDAIKAYLADRTVVPEYAQPIWGNLDLVSRCFQVLLKHAGPNHSENRLATQAVDEVLPWFPKSLRKQIASQLLQDLDLETLREHLP